MSDVKITCLSIDCPERTGGKCWAELDRTVPEIVRELRALREVYRIFHQGGSWDRQMWYMAANPIADRLEQLTGSRA